MVIWWVLLLLSSALAKEQLLFVSTILRHGARNMIFGNYILTDDKEFIRNPGRLTDIGKRQLYLLGNQLGKYYINDTNFLPFLYDPKTIVARTSGLNRTIESVQGLLTGIYIPGTGPSLEDIKDTVAIPSIKVENIDEIIKGLKGGALPEKMRIIPIHTANEDKDYLFNPHTECRSINKENILHKQDFQEIDIKYESLYNKIAKYGIHINSIEGVYNLYNDMATVEGNAVHKNIIFTEDIVKGIQDIVEEHGRMIMLYSKRKIKLLSHAALFDVIKYFEDTYNKAKNGKLNEDRVKMSLLHVSDIHILAISQILKLHIIKQDTKNKILVPVDIPYASLLRFELYRDSEKKGDEEYRVRVIYNNETTIVGIEGIETLKEFINYLKANTYKNEEEFYEDCFREPTPDDYNKTKYIIISVIIMIVLIIIWGVSWLLIFKSRNNAPVALTGVTVEGKGNYLGFNTQGKDSGN